MIVNEDGYMPLEKRFAVNGSVYFRVGESIMSKELNRTYVPDQNYTISAGLPDDAPIWNILNGWMNSGRAVILSKPKPSLSAIDHITQLHLVGGTDTA